MPLLKFAAAALAFFASHTASASVISSTQAFSGSTGSLNGSNANLQIPDFNPQQGTLTQLTLQFTGTLTDEVEFGQAPSETGQFSTANNAQLFGSGFSSLTSYGLASGAINVTSATRNAFSNPTGFGFTAILSGAALADYTPTVSFGSEQVGINFGFALLDANGNRISASDAETAFNGQLTETYTFTPTAVPEPATFLLATTALLGLTAIRRKPARQATR